MGNEIQNLAEDALRYRWLRENFGRLVVTRAPTVYEDMDYITSVEVNVNLPTVDTHSVDAAIDAHRPKLTITRNEAGEIVAATLQNDEHRVTQVLWSKE